MKRTAPWHHTRLGALAIWLGSVQLAVPVLILVAVALAIGTYLESAHNVRVARAVVYGSWWFVGLMALVCVSLVFAVVTRFPWKRRHIGFITVHAGLVTLIVGGFWSMFGRVEGQLGLTEGASGDSIETPEEQIELLRHDGGQFTTLGVAPVRSGAASVGGVRVQVLERWDHCTEEETVTDDAPMEFRAVLVSTHAGAEPIWVGDEAKAGGAPAIHGIRVRVLSDGATWTPPTPPASGEGGYVFLAGESRVPLSAEGDEALPGWRIVSIRRFARATVATEGLTESPSGPENPAVDVVIEDGKGSSERHTAFEQFPDVVLNRPLSGDARSGARLAPAGAREPESLVVFGTIDRPRVGYVGTDGRGVELNAPTTLPWTAEAGGRRVQIVRQFARARGSSRVVRAATIKDSRPALVLRVGDATDLVVAPWKGTVPLGTSGQMIRYGPRMVPIPFSVRLADFRKVDYPGTDMAMAYESDVAIMFPGQPETPFRIFMNNPYIHGPWRVYQSGFVGETFSIFSVMRDPGIPLTYAGAIVLCVGIVITFYSRSLSWGHPGIPIPFAKERTHAVDPPSPAGDPAPVHAGAGER